MTSSRPISESENLTLLEANRLMLQELTRLNSMLSVLLHNQQQQVSQLADLVYLINGFTSGGASFSGYIADPMTQAYLAVVGPLLAAKLAPKEQELPELMKGATLLAKQLIEELAAYRSERGALDYLEDQTELIHDPWASKEHVDPA